nr:hypothetical protein [uncultured Cohaesibacter sp.]
MFRFVFLVSAFLSSTALADSQNYLETGKLDMHVPHKEEALAIKESSAFLIEQSYILDEECRGNTPQVLIHYVSCAKRDIYDVILEHRGFCNGTFDKDGYLVSRDWHKCGPEDE